MMAAQMDAFGEAPRRSKRQLPEDFRMTPQIIAWAAQQGISEAEARASFDYFVDYCAGKGGKPYADYQAALRNCMRADWGRVIATMRRNPERQVAYSKWHETAGGIEEKGRELGLYPRDFPNFPAFKAAVFRKAGVR